MKKNFTNTKTVRWIERCIGIIIFLLTVFYPYLSITRDHILDLLNAIDQTAFNNIIYYVFVLSILSGILNDIKTYDRIFIIGFHKNTRDRNVALVVVGLCVIIGFVMPKYTINIYIFSALFILFNVLQHIFWYYFRIYLSNQLKDNLRESYRRLDKSSQVLSFTIRKYLYSDKWIYDRFVISHLFGFIILMLLLYGIMNSFQQIGPFNNLNIMISVIIFFVMIITEAIIWMKRFKRNALIEVVDKIYSKS